MGKKINYKRSTDATVRAFFAFKKASTGVRVNVLSFVAGYNAALAAAEENNSDRDQNRVDFEEAFPCVNVEEAARAAEADEAEADEAEADEAEADEAEAARQVAAESRQVAKAAWETWKHAAAAWEEAKRKERVTARRLYNRRTI